MDIQYKDGSRSKFSIFNSQNKNALLFILLPAMGTRASYYEPFAIKLNESGYNVITFDWRGAGNSSIRASRNVDFGYKELIEDFKESVEMINLKFSENKKILIGHSLGGQIGSLFISRYPDIFNGLILIASSSVYYKGWSGFNAFKVKLDGLIFYPISKVVGYFPGKLIGFGGNEARSIMKDWSENALTGNYENIDKDYNYEDSLKRLSIPVLTISIKEDFLASKKAVENLYQKFNNQTIVSHFHINEDDSGIRPLNHFSWVKKPDFIISLIENWMRKNL